MDEIRLADLLFQTLRNGCDPRKLHDLMRRPEAARLQRKFQRMYKIVEAKAQVHTRVGAP